MASSGQDYLDVLGPGDFWHRSKDRVLAGWARGTRALDVGCGLGGLSVRLARLGFSVTALEPHAPYLERAREDGRGLGIEFLGCDAWGYESPPRFDTVFLSGVLEHVERDEELLVRARGWLVPGGRLVVLVSAHPWLRSAFDHEVGHLRRYTRAGLRRTLEAAGCAVEAMRYWNALALPALLWTKATGRLVPRSLLAAPVLDRAFGAWLRFAESPLPLPLGADLIAAARRPLEAGGALS